MRWGCPIGAAGTLETADAVRSDAVGAAGGAPGSPTIGVAAAVAPVDVDPAVAGPREARAVAPDGLRQTKFK